MKTTVQISDALLAEVQKIAAKNKTTLRALVDEGLRHVVEREHTREQPYKMKDCSVGGEGLHPDVQGLTPAEIIASSYGDRGGDRS